MTVGASSCPRSLSSWKRGAGTQRGEWGGASPASQGWIPAFAGMTVGARQDARYPFSANLPDRYLWMTLDSSV